MLKSYFDVVNQRKYGHKKIEETVQEISVCSFLYFKYGERFVHSQIFRNMYEQ